MSYTNFSHQLRLYDQEFTKPQSMWCWRCTCPWTSLSRLGGPKLAETSTTIWSGWRGRHYSPQLWDTSIPFSTGCSQGEVFNGIVSIVDFTYLCGGYTLALRVCCLAIDYPLGLRYQHRTPPWWALHHSDHAWDGSTGGHRAHAPHGWDRPSRHRAHALCFVFHFMIFVL